MSADLPESQASVETSENFLEQIVKGSRKTSNYIVAAMLTIGGIGFSLAALSSYFGKDSSDRFLKEFLFPAISNEESYHSNVLF